MTDNQVANQVQVPAIDQKQQDKELNFRALEAKYRRELEQERAARTEAERIAKEYSSRRVEEDDNDDEPYVNDKKLNRRLSDFERRIEERIDKKSEEKAYHIIQQDKQQSWLKNNPDFYDVMQHAEKFAQRDPELAETILQMPEGFERKKLVYKTIKSMGLHQPEVKQPTIQDKIDANKRSPYYQPTGVGASPYASQGNFSPSGQKEAYDKMKELQNRLRG
jgi:hypothetical protein